MNSEENEWGPPRHRSPDRVLISGSTGFIGRALIEQLTASGYTVVPLLRGRSPPGNPHWNPGAGTLNPAVVSGFDTVIHLAGEPVIGRWTNAKKCRILESRVHATSELATALAAAELSNLSVAKLLHTVDQVADAASGDRVSEYALRHNLVTFRHGNILHVVFQTGLF